MHKSELRKIYLEKRASLSPAEVAAASREIADRFFKNVDLPPGCVLHTFIRIGRFNEIDTSMIYYRLWRDRPDVAIAAPRTDLDTGEIESIAFDASSDWKENRFGIREPAGGKFIEPSDVDVVIVPLLAFDTKGHRIGYGKGIYDRFLARCRPDCVRAGLSLFPPVEEIQGIIETDIALDLCLTPAAVFQFDKTVQPVQPESAAPAHH
jgi:5-formyltetrahydrofolate cyclo-ligase